MNVGSNLKALRKRKKLSQEDVATALSMHRSTYSGYENDVALPNIENLIAFSQFHELLIDDLSKVADPDNALLLLVRIADQQDKNLDQVLKDDDARLRLLQVLGSSNGLGEHLVTYPEDVLVFLEESAINKASTKNDLIQIFTKASKTSRANLVREYRKVLLGLASRDICYKWPLRDVAAELADAADAILQSALNTAIDKNPELAKQFKLAILLIFIITKFLFGNWIQCHC